MNIFSQFSTLLNHPNNRGSELQTLIRIITWKINQLLFKLPKIVKLTDSCRIICYPNSSYASFIVYARFPEYYEMSFIQSVVKKKWTFFDVGANIGAISLLAASQMSTGKVYAFEPTPMLISKFNQNVLLNKFENKITLVVSAVANKVGVIEFTCESESEVNHITGNSGSRSKSTLVPTVTLDAFANKKKISHIDFLKIDVEGAELLVFQGAKKLLEEGRIGIILFELNKNCKTFGYQFQDIFKLLAKEKYSFFLFDTNGALHEIDIARYALTKTENIIAVQKQTKYFEIIESYL
ncbi:MAG: hypothetical protein A2632_01290 [Candidatus Pacebacteria bacterium RIFCSPHIGHO2_01_FULL_46_16]|nr:MAG: hypothetical protein A2632_01290 [Candidatus Pacebacteria bacterium RIFCSPHIGHO2_01_FULL_46_16]